MAINYGYYLPLSESIYTSVRFLDIQPKMNGLGATATQQTDIQTGVPKWVVSALVKTSADAKPETEDFTLTAPDQIARQVGELAELTPIRLVGLMGGKWSKAGSDRTDWSFQISGVALIK